MAAVYVWLLISCGDAQSQSQLARDLFSYIMGPILNLMDSAVSDWFSNKKKLNQDFIIIIIIICFKK